MLKLPQTLDGDFVPQIAEVRFNMFWLNSLGKRSEKKNSGYNEFSTKGGGVSDLNHYLKQI